MSFFFVKNCDKIFHFEVVAHLTIRKYLHPSHQDIGAAPEVQVHNDGGYSGVVHFYFLRRLLRANKWLLKTSTNNVPSLALIMFG